MNFLETFPLAKRLLEANKTHASLASSRELAKSGDDHLTFEDDLLLYDGKLIVPEVDYIRTELVQAVHDQPSTAHPGTKKTLVLLQERYY